MTTYLKLIAIFLLAPCPPALAAESAESPYVPSWTSLYRHKPAPEWFQDAKFGIYFHWGVYTVPAFGNEWYPRWMHYEGDSFGICEHHKKTYGDPSVFGYHDFIPMFKAEKFDPEEWADLFKKAGARFAGPVAEHHDGYAMWDSELTPWNAMDTGPKRDITGEMAKAIRDREMKFITTFHHDRHLQRPWRPKEDIHEPTKNRKFWDGHYPPVAGWPTTSNDPKLQMLYGNMAEGPWLEHMWKGKLLEVIDKYEPDMIWFDVWLDFIPDRYQMEFLAHYFNKTAESGREAMVACKHLDMPREIAVEDFEKGRLDKLVDYPWMTDDTISIGSWSYTKNMTIKPTRQVLHSLIDIVSKNGALLLNISPTAEGVIPEDQRKVLLEIGAWLGQYGAAIYDTRPWAVYGEGPTEFDMGRGGHFIKDKPYTAEDIRFTRSKDGSKLHAIPLGWPPEGKLKISSIPAHLVAGQSIGRVRLIGQETDLKWEIVDGRLEIELPAVAPALSQFGAAFEISLVSGNP